MNLKRKFFNNIQGYVFDEQIAEDIRKNQLAYSWERGIPATQFMPAIGWLRIIERYKFALSFIKPSDVVLEAACGFGYGAAYFHDKCKMIYVLDLAQENTKFAKHSYDFDNISWTNGNVTKLPYENNKFDVYTSFETLEHLPLNLIEDYFKEAVRVLKHDGIMIISTPNREMRKNVHNPFHIKEYTYNEFDKMLYKYFSKIQYYSVVNYRVEDEMKKDAVNMIAVCYK